MKQQILSPMAVQSKLAEKNIRLFSVEEFRRVFDLSSVKAKYFLETYTKKGLFVRLKKGLYVLQNQIPGEQEIANGLYKPSYISFEYALSKYGVIPEMVYIVTSATTKPTRYFSADNKEFHFFSLKKEVFTGYSLIKENGKSFLIAEPEKALADYLYFVSLGKKAMSDRVDITKLKKEKILRYAHLFNRPSLITLVKNL